MTEIRYRKTGKSVRWSVVGHAGYNPGNDPVCAGVSVITFQLLNVLNNLQEHGKIENFVPDLSDGSSIVYFDVNDSETWDIVQKVIMTGYEIISEQYPDYVKMVGVNTH